MILIDHRYCMVNNTTDWFMELGDLSCQRFEGAAFEHKLRVDAQRLRGRVLSMVEYRPDPDVKKFPQFSCTLPPTFNCLVIVKPFPQTKPLLNNAQLPSSWLQRILSR